MIYSRLQTKRKRPLTRAGGHLSVFDFGMSSVYFYLLLRRTDACQKTDIPTPQSLKMDQSLYCRCNIEISAIMLVNEMKDTLPLTICINDLDDREAVRADLREQLVLNMLPIIFIAHLSHDEVFTLRSVGKEVKFMHQFRREKTTQERDIALRLADLHELVSRLLALDPAEAFFEGRPDDKAHMVRIEAAWMWADHLVVADQKLHVDLGR